MVLDGNQGPKFNGIGRFIVFSPDSRHVAYPAGDDPTVVVLDGKQLGAYKDVQSDSVVFSPDSAHLAFWANDKGTTTLYLDGRPVGTSDEPLLFSVRFLPDSKGTFYAFKRAGKAYLSFSVLNRDATHF